MRNILTAAALAATVVLTGCQTTGPNQTLGTIGGGALGGYVGSTIGSGDGRLIATAIGVSVGMLLGGEIGRQYDQRDVATTGQILETKQTGTTHEWNNPDTGRTYAMTPTRTFQPVANGKYCREFIIQDATVAGRPGEQVYGTACRQPDGTWEMVGR